MHICVCVYIYIPRYNLVSPHNVLYVVRADHLALNCQLAYSSLEKTTSPSPSFAQLPVVPYVWLRPCRFSPIQFGKWLLLKMPRTLRGKCCLLITGVEGIRDSYVEKWNFRPLYHRQKSIQSILKTLAWWMAHMYNPIKKTQVTEVEGSLGQSRLQNDRVPASKVQKLCICV